MIKPVWHRTLKNGLYLEWIFYQERLCEYKQLIQNMYKQKIKC